MRNINLYFKILFSFAFIFCAIYYFFSKSATDILNRDLMNINYGYVFLSMIFGSLALENTILKWSSDHRKHHSYAETEDDPYSITKGFWHAHIGWIVKNTPEEKSKISGVKDLENKSAIIFQNKYYYHIAVIGGILVPLSIGLIYGRPIGAVLWGSFLRITLVHHATFLINSGIADEAPLIYIIIILIIAALVQAFGLI